MATKAKSQILDAVHETAVDLHRLGFIDKRKMQKYEALCLEPVPEYDAVKIRALRARFHLSQAVLAAALNTSASTVRKHLLAAGVKTRTSEHARKLRIQTD